MSLTASIHALKTRRLGRASVAAALAAGAIAIGAAAHDAESATGDNVIFILTDDQAAGEISVMPNLQALIGAQGVTFNRALISYPLCCPSRASLLSGRYMHNHGVRGNHEPNGGWQRFRPLESRSYPVWTEEAGYYNVHIGKYMNGYASGPPRPLPVPTGWDEWYGKISEDNLYFNYTTIEQDGTGDTPELAFYGDQPSDYQTDVFGRKAIEFIDGLEAGETPFLMNLWFNAPHAPFDAAPRHRFSLNTARVPKPRGFNEKNISDKPKWLRKQIKKRLKKAKRKAITAETRRRYEQLLSVDEAIAALVSKLAAAGLLDETYIIFASDNGFFRGEHRLTGGKFLPYEPATRVPLMIRGPGIPAGGVSEELVSNLDLTQTIREIATGSSDSSLDGRSLLPYAHDPALRSTRPILLEGDTGPGAGAQVEPELASAAVARARLAGKRGVGDLDQEPMAGTARTKNSAPAYKAIRTHRYLYVLYGNGQKELYDMRRDPGQLRSKHRDRRYRQVRRWLRTHLFSLAACSGAICRHEVGPEPKPRKGSSDSKSKGKAKGR